MKYSTFHIHHFRKPEMKYSLPLEQTITFNLIDLFKFNVIVCFYYFIFNLFKPVIQVLITILYIIVVKVINFSQCSLGCLIALLKGVYKCFLLNLRNNITILITHQNIFVNPLISRNFNLGIPPTFL